MATSGSTNFSLGRNDLLTSAFRLIGVGLDGNAISAQMMNDASQVLNMMVKAWQADGLQLWAQKNATLFLQSDTSTYNLSTSGSGHATASYVETTVKTAAAASATTIDITSTTGITAGDYIGFVLDDDSSHWTTVSSVTDSDTLVIASGLASAAAVGNAVYAYTSKISQPLRITECVRRTNDNDIPLVRISREEYWALPNKTQSGVPNQFYFDPQLSNGVLYVYPTPDDALSTLEIVYHRPFEDFDSTTDTPDFPQWWYEPLRYGLALRMGHEYGVPERIIQRLTLDSERMKARAMAFDQEDTSIFIRPKRYGN